MELDPNKTDSAHCDARSRLLNFINADDPYHYDYKSVREQQHVAVNELYLRRRKEIPVLDKFARDFGVEEIGVLKDIVPLLFAHQTYKSYPDSFVKHDKWALMNRWLGSLSTKPIGNIDVSGVRGIDQWVATMSAHGHHVLLSSGTSGKASFLNRTKWDVDLTQQNVTKCIRLTQNISNDAPRRPVFLLGPNKGTHIFVGVMHAIAAEFARPDSTYWLSDLELTEADLQRQAMLRNKIAEGSATPSELQELEASAVARQAAMRKSIRALAQALIKHKDEPVMLVGLWLPHFLLLEEARASGLGDGAIHKDSTVFVGGGLKGARLPDDFRQQLAKFHGLASGRYHRVYGMVELSAPFLGCSEGRYHCPPWVVPLVLDKKGEQLLEQDAGVTEGRMAFVDLATEGRWGGVITGDKVEVDFSECGCGRASPSVKSIVRYTDIEGGDDKLSCAGTMASYVRGVIEE